MGYISYITVLLALYILGDFSIQKGDGNLLQYSCTRIGTIMSRSVRNEMVPHQTSIVIVRNCLAPMRYFVHDTPRHVRYVS